MPETLPEAVQEIPGIVDASVSRGHTATPGYFNTSVMLTSTFSEIDAATLARIAEIIRDTNSYTQRSTGRIHLKIYIGDTGDCVPLEAAAQEIALPGYASGKWTCEFFAIYDDDLPKWKTPR